MMKPYWKSIFLVFIFSLSLFSSCATTNETNCLRLSQLSNRYLALVEKNQQFKINIIGNIKYSNQDYQITSIEYRPKAVIQYHVLNVGGIHGNEPGGVESVNQLIENCYNALPNNIAMDFIICINPWGYTHNKRNNGNGIDLNRDFENFKSEEASLIRKYLYDKKYDLIFDHHENMYSDGFSIISFDKINEDFLDTVISSMVNKGYEIASKLENTTNYRNGLTQLKVNTKKGFLQYASFVSCISDHVFTIETPTTWNMDKRVECHVQFVKDVVDMYLK
jgi:hypothetical protein